MTDKEKIRELLYQFEYGGLISGDKDMVFNCLADRFLGIGIGEQGFVTSLQDVGAVLTSGAKTDDGTEHSIEFGRVEILIEQEIFAVVCADVHIHTRPGSGGGRAIETSFQQSLTVIKERGIWKICGLHASAPLITEEDIEAYPLKFAEETLRNLKEKIGEEVYLREEQYRLAVLADTIAFYIIDFNKNCFERCQINSNQCVYMEANSPYQQCIDDLSSNYVHKEDLERFINLFSLDNVLNAFAEGINELSCEYRMISSEGNYVWVKTIVRLITDVMTGRRKGIMYVKNIDKDKQVELENRKRADLDGMTKVYNRAAMIREVTGFLQETLDSEKGAFMMLDVDNFKLINDTYGHPAGDAVLIAIAKTLKEIFLPPACIGRLGGDEFAVFVCSDLQGDNVKKKIEDLQLKVRELRLPMAPELLLSVSIGVAQKTESCFEELYHLADEALYLSKKQGKDCACFLP